MDLHESGQMYLETIYILTKRGGNVRSIDVGTYMGFSKPSVSRAVGLLKRNGYITVEKNGRIALTPKGLETAEKIYDRHVLLTELLIRLGTDAETAEKDACKLEHDISDKSIDAIKAFLEKNTKTG